MFYYVEILGTLPEMGKAEVEALAELGVGNVEKVDYLLVSGSVKHIGVFERLGLAHEYGLLLYEGDDIKDILDFAKGLEWRNIINGTFAVRRERMRNCMHEVNDLDKK